MFNVILYGSPRQCNVQLVNKPECAVTHAEAYITLCSYKLNVTAHGAQTIRILSVDTDVCNHSGCHALESAASDLHVLSVCYTVSYPFRKGKKSTLKLLDIYIYNYDHVFGQAGITHARLNATAYSFFLLFYGQKSCMTINEARARVFCGRGMTRH